MDGWRMTPTQLIEKYGFTARDFVLEQVNLQSGIKFNVSGDVGMMAARVANAKLLKLFEGAKVVVCDDMTYWGSNIGHPNPTHTAILVCIEELPKAECKHEPDYTQFAIDEKYNTGKQMKCKNCGINLKATWEPT